MTRKECIQSAMLWFSCTKSEAKLLANACEKYQVPYEVGLVLMSEEVNKAVDNAILYGDDDL